MRVLHINAVYGQGSTGVIVRNIHNKALQEQLGSYVAYAHPNHKTNKKNTYIIGGKIDHKLHAVLARINGKQAYYSRNSTKKLLLYIDTIKPDIVHLHNLHSNYINLNLLLKFLADNNISTVITLHDCWFFTGGCFHYTKENCSRWITTCGKCPKKCKDTPAYLSDKSEKILKDKRFYFSKLKDLTVVGVSEWITEEAKKFFSSNVRFTTIYNGVDLEFYKSLECKFREQYRLNGKFLILGMANKWLKPENKELLKYFVEHLDDDCKMVIVGCTRKQLQLLSKKVLGIPYVDSKKLVEIYSACNVFVNCTREESLSLVNVESQACGTPVITYSNTGVKETVDGISGYCVEVGDIECMFEMVMRVKKNGKEYYSDKCRKFIEQRFEKEKQNAQYVNLYNDIYERKDRR